MNGTDRPYPEDSAAHVTRGHECLRIAEGLATAQRHDRVAAFSALAAAHFAAAQAPAPGGYCAPITSAQAGHPGAGPAVVEVIDVLTRQLHDLRARLADEIRRAQDARAAEVDAMLADRRDGTQ